MQTMVFGAFSHAGQDLWHNFLAIFSPQVAHWEGLKQFWHQLYLPYLVGSIPFIGDAFDFVWKANKQNMELIRTRAAGHGRGKTSDYIFVFGLIFLLTGILIGSIVASAMIIYWILNNLSNI